MTRSTRVDVCRSCGFAELQEVLACGSTPIANSLARTRAEAVGLPRYPLGIVFCPRCTLVQLANELPATALFDSDYPYYSSFSESLCRHAKVHVDGLIARHGLGSGSLFVELASNDGYLLQYAQLAGVPVLGIDPAPGPAAAAMDKGIETINDFFDPAMARRLVHEGRRADVIVANNVMAHVPDLNGFVEGMSILLSDTGVITVENPYVGTMIDKREFDTIYHEHYCYFSCTAVDQVMQRHGLYLNEVEYFPDLHGGTCRWTISRSPHRADSARQYLEDEIERGLTSPAYYERFAEEVADLRTRFRDLCHQLRDEGCTIVAYGAAAKGATLLNHADLVPGTIDYVVDRNTHKQGHFMPGVGIPILPVERLLEDPPDYLVLLAWNFAAEIQSQQVDYLEAGGRFIVPVPDPVVL